MRIGGTVMIENKPGAGGNIGIGIAAHAEPDGYTLLVTSSAYVVNPGLYAKVPYDPYKDFAPIAELGDVTKCHSGRSKARCELDRRTDRTRQGQSE